MLKPRNIFSYRYSIVSGLSLYNKGLRMASNFTLQKVPTPLNFLPKKQFARKPDNCS